MAGRSNSHKLLFVYSHCCSVVQGNCQKHLHLKTPFLLQLHFRLSATILKLLEAGNLDLDHELLFSLLVEAATGPFARGEEKSMPSMPRSNEKYAL